MKKIQWQNVTPGGNRTQAPPRSRPPPQEQAPPSQEQAPPQSRPPPGSTPPRSTPPPLWTEFLTHAYENITLPQTSFAGGNKNRIGRQRNTHICTQSARTFWVSCIHWWKNNLGHPKLKLGQRDLHFFFLIATWLQDHVSYHTERQFTAIRFSLITISCPTDVITQCRKDSLSCIRPNNPVQTRFTSIHQI